MLSVELLILNLEEIRRRSLILWNSLPEENYDWQPDETAMTCLEMIRHILEGEHLFHIIVKNRGNLNDYISPWQDKDYTTVQDEIDFALPYRNAFLTTLKSFTANDLETIEIVRTEKNQRRKLGDYLLRIAYHESVHTGQLLSYYRTMEIKRPLIWD
jgi:uncharacterized damage-inducible protein DinB